MNENVNYLKQEIENLKSEINAMREGFKITYAKVANHEKVNASLLNNNIDLQSQIDVFMQKVEEAKISSQKKTDLKEEKKEEDKARSLTDSDPHE